MRLTELLGIRPGERVAVVGAGGKSALIDQLADENAARGVLIAPTTRIGLDQVRARAGVTYLGAPEGDKLVAAPLREIEAAAGNHALTLMEADGSKRMMLKGWAAHEPVVPGFATLTLGVVSARAVGLRATAETVHRLAEFLQQTGLREGDTVDGAALMRMIRWCLDRHAVGRRVIAMRGEDGTWSAI